MDLNVLIVEDEWLARARLQRLLAERSDIGQLATCETASAAREALRQTPVDLAFLDVEMPGADGFAVLEGTGTDRVSSVPLATVFVTAFSQHAARAFEVGAIDYLVKPVDGPRLAVAMERAKRFVHGHPKRRYPNRLALRSGGRVRFVPASAIDFIEAHGNYVCVHVDGHEELSRETMGDIQQRLDPRCFLRVHRRHIVNRDRIAELEPHPSGGFGIVLSSGEQLVAGRKYRSELLALLQ